MVYFLWHFYSSIDLVANAFSLNNTPLPVAEHLLLDCRFCNNTTFGIEMDGYILFDLQYNNV